MVRISMGRKQLLTLLVASLAIALIVFVLHYLSSKGPIMSYSSYDTQLGFRADLRKASKIPIYPNEAEINGMVWSLAIPMPGATKQLNIVFVNSSDNPLVSVEAFEIAYKLTVAYKYYNYDVNITAREVNSYDNLNATDTSLVVAIVPPSFANETVVNSENGVIYIEGTSKQNLDMATVKFLMAALDISI